MVECSLVSFIHKDCGRVNLYMLVCRLVREVFTPIIRTPLMSPDEWSENFTKQAVD